MNQVLEKVRVHAIPAFTDNYIWMMHDAAMPSWLIPATPNRLQRLWRRWG